jgi:hypothetical protein
MSAGNHAQALAYHGHRLGVPTTIVMPRFTPNAKVAQTRVFGAEVILHGSEFDEARQFTLELAEERALTLVHPYDDPRVIAGQGTLGLELLEQAPGHGGRGGAGGRRRSDRRRRQRHQGAAPDVRVVGMCRWSASPARTTPFTGVEDGHGARARWPRASPSSRREGTPCR